VSPEVATVSHATAPPGTIARKAGVFLVCLVLELLVFAILPLSARFPVGSLLYVHAGLTAILLAAALVAARSHAGRPYWQLLYALFAAGTAVLLGTVLGGRLLEALRIVPVSAAWIALAKLSESFWRVLAILALMLAAGADLRSMYLAKGRLGLGLAAGLAGFVACAALAFLPLSGQAGGKEKLLSFAPWILIFVLSNGFAEELLFRGLFLRRFEAFLGKGLSNLVAALAFTLLHVQVTYISDLAVFLLVLFPLALVWGWLMQKTGSLWGSALFHAGADCLLVFGIFGGL
jgi:membrane protease YdiL (CAAX protease family)